MDDTTNTAENYAEDDSLCAFCANRDECSEHHMMCVNFDPIDTKKPEKEVQQ